MVWSKRKENRENTLVLQVKNMSYNLLWHIQQWHIEEFEQFWKHVNEHYETKIICLYCFVMIVQKDLVININTLLSSITITTHRLCLSMYMNYVHFLASQDM